MAKEKTKKAPKQEKVDKKEDVKNVKIIERVIENTAITPQDVFGKLNRPQIELLKRTIAKGADDDELKLFIQVCKGANLNPFLRQVFLVPRWDSRTKKEVRTIQVSIDGFRSIAESSGAYAGNDDPKYDGEEETKVGQGQYEKLMKHPTKATVTVYKMVEGNRYEFTATARWAEYYPGPKMGFQWHQRPYLMIGKCAEALALRKAFPKLLSGMYAQEEMDQAQVETNEAKNQKAALDYVKQSIGRANLEELQELKKLITKSPKYDKSQKMEFLNMVDSKIKELK